MSIPLIIILVIVVVLVVAVIGLYNNLVKLRNMVDNAWAQIDVQLQRRLDLIPNLVETCLPSRRHTPTSRRTRTSSSFKQSCPTLKTRSATCAKASTTPS